MGNFVEITMERSKAKRALRQWSEPGLKKEKQEPTVSATRTVSFFQYLTIFKSKKERNIRDESAFTT
jgi:hypothetical protein